jgi:hypothetical protein
VRVSAETRTAGGVSSWVVLGSSDGRPFAELDVFQLDPALAAAPSQLAQLASGACLVCGRANGADGRFAVVRGSSDCSSFSTWDQWQPDDRSGAGASGIAVSGDAAYVVGDVGDGTSSFVRRSRDGGRSWSTVAMLPQISLRSVVAGQDGTLYALGVSGTSARLLRTQDDGASWAEADRYACAASCYFHGPGRPALVEGLGGAIYSAVAYIPAGGVQAAVIRRYDPAASVTQEVGLFDRWPHAGGLRADPRSGSVYLAGRAPLGVPTKAAIWVLRHGATQWRMLETYQQDPGRDSETDAVAVAPDGTVWSAGFSWGAAGLQTVIRQLQ